MYTAQKMKFSIKDFNSRRRIWSHLLKKSLVENFIFCAECIIANEGSLGVLRIQCFRISEFFDRFLKLKTPFLIGVFYVI